nr:four helix bundle protein [Gloeotrichia echinulata DEX184]
MGLACAAIPIKIAQGCDRHDRQEQVTFLQLAKDSAIDLEYYLYPRSAYSYIIIPV